MKSKPNPPKLGRNAPCHCGSGKKYKKCHVLIEQKEREETERLFRERMAEKALEAQKRRQALLSHPDPFKSTPMRMGMMPFMLVAASLAASMPPIGRKTH